MSEIISIKEHKVRCGDIMDGLDTLMGPEKADIIYTDPPWGSGNLRYWQTMNSKMNSVPKKELDYQAFIAKIFEVLRKYAKGVIFLEYGKRWNEEIVRMIKAGGFVYGATVQTVYSSIRLPMDLHIFSINGIPLQKEHLEKISGTQAMATVLNATEPFRAPGGIVLDPCCGHGNSARMAIAYGMRFRGNEINRTRLNRTIKILET